MDVNIKKSDMGGQGSHWWGILRNGEGNYGMSPLQEDIISELEPKMFRFIWVQECLQWVHNKKISSMSLSQRSGLDSSEFRNASNESTARRYHQWTWAKFRFRVFWVQESLFQWSHEEFNIGGVLPEEFHLELTYQFILSSRHSPGINFRQLPFTFTSIPSTPPFFLFFPQVGLIKKSHMAPSSLCVHIHLLSTVNRHR